MMENVGVLESYRQKRLSLFQWRVQSTVWAKIALAGGMACLTGVLAQVKFYLPWTPVPIVASQFGVILAAILLGRKWGAISMTLYALGGLAGIPWFAGFKGGIVGLTGPTGGYILGFILAALFMGNLLDAKVEARRFIPLTAVILFAQLVLVYVPGLIHLTLWLKWIGGQNVTLMSVLWMGYIPFILGDVIKSLVGVGMAKLILPMEKF